MKIVVFLFRKGWFFVAGTPKADKIPPVILDVLVKYAAAWCAEYSGEVLGVE